MRNSAQCLRKAADMLRRAASCKHDSMSADYLLLAQDWRNMASRARWQDTISELNPTPVL